MTGTHGKVEHWQGSASPAAVEALSEPGGMIVCATKVGYIVMTGDGAGLERKFEAKNRKRSKPGVVLCASLDQLFELADLNDEARALYERHDAEDILLGCIAPWRPEATRLLPDATTRELAVDPRGTSCFVVRFGRPAEQIVSAMWEGGRRLVFASSANPSGVGNKGRMEGVGSRILDAADHVVEADDYVESCQPGKDVDSRHEQGVMVSLVDGSGTAVPLQSGERGVSPAPALIRRGLDYDRIMVHLSAVYPSWDYRQGEYY